MKVTREMIDAAKRHLTPTPFEPTIEAAIGAVLKVIDPVPDDVTFIIDYDGGKWSRDSDDPMVWIYEGAGMYRTYLDIEERWGPITWKGKK